MTSTKFAVILSGREKFGPHYGGAVARWTYEVYRRLPGSIEATVFGFPQTSGDAYDLPFQAATNNWISGAAARVPFIRRYEDTIWLAQLMPKLRAFDVVHLQNRPNWSVILRKLGYTGKIVGHLHNPHLAHHTPDQLKQLAPHLECVVSCSKYIASTFVPRCPEIAEKSVVVYNGVDTSAFTPDASSRVPKRVFYVGRIHPEKGVLPLVQAFRVVARRHPDAELVIGGSTGFGTHETNEYVLAVQQESRRLESEFGAKVRFTGYINHSELPRQFREASLAVVPSICQDAFGLVVCEAMACGTPVVATNRGGLPEVVGDAGILIDAPAPEKIAEGILLLLNDNARRDALAQRALSRARLFDWQNIADRWSDLLSIVAAGHPVTDLPREPLSSENSRPSSALLS